MKAAAQASAAPRPPRAVVGSQISFEEEMFGAAFDGRVIRRFWSFVVPHRRHLGIGVVAVLIFTLTQIAIPLVLRYAIDDALSAGSAGLEVLHWIVIAFFAVAGLNYASNFTQEFIVGRISGSLLFDLRRAMYRHLQHVSLSFMDKTEVGRLMSRLQGRRQRPAGVPRDLHLCDRRLRPPHRHRYGSAVSRSAPRSAHPLGGAGADRGAYRLAAARETGIHARAGDQLDRKRGARGERARRSHHPGDGPGSRQLRAVRRQGEGQPARAPARVEVLQRDDPDRRHAHRHRDGNRDRGRRRHGTRAANSSSE